MKIGLVLSGGGAKSFVYIGLLKALEENNIEISAMTGVSAGAVIGALYSLGFTASAIEEIALKVDWKDIIDISLLPKESFLTNKKLIKFYHHYFTDKTFDDCKIPLKIISTDLIAGDKYVFNTGNIAEALLASSAIPGIFPPVKHDDKLLVDGGVVDNTPIESLKEIYKGLSITADTYPEMNETKFENIIDILFRSYRLLDKNKIFKALSKADYVFKPNLKDIGITSIKKTKEIIQEGYDCFYREQKSFNHKLRFKKIKNIFLFKI